MQGNRRTWPREQEIRGRLDEEFRFDALNLRWLRRTGETWTPCTLDDVQRRANSLVRALTN
jgi:hypothetical protein